MRTSTDVMNMVIVTDRWNAAGGGRERYLSDLRSSVQARGWAVDLALAEHLGERRLPRAIGQIRGSDPAVRIMTARPVHGATHYQLHSGVYANAYAAERDAFDSRLRRLCYWPALRLNRKRSRLLRIEERLLTGPAGPRLLVFSTAARDEVQRMFGTSPERIEVSRPGVDLRMFRPPEADSDGRHSGARALAPVRLLFVGHNFALKGLRWAIEAVAQARRDGIPAQLTVAGLGQMRAFASLARKAGIATHVRLVGDVAHDRLAQIYRESDLLIHPTFYDPFPRVILEALASGCPVVTTRRCGAAEILSPGCAGFVVEDPRSVDGLVQAIAAVADRDRRLQMGAAASALARRFDFETHVDDVAAWLGRPC